MYNQNNSYLSVKMHCSWRINDTVVLKNFLHSLRTTNPSRFPRQPQNYHSNPEHLHHNLNTTIHARAHPQSQKYHFYQSKLQPKKYRSLQSTSTTSVLPFLLEHPHKHRTTIPSRVHPQPQKEMHQQQKLGTITVLITVNHNCS